MGLSTFIEINNDFANEIGKNPAEFIGELLIFLHTGQSKTLPKGVNRMMTVHRDCKEYKKIHKLMHPII